MKMQEFNKISTTSNFIKNLLYTTYLPLIRTVRVGDYVVEDRLYIYKCNVIKCIQSGYLDKSPNNRSSMARYTMLQEYKFGDRNDKLCTRYLSNNEGYDYKTHERLGNYLRCLRDMYDLNLMPLYNCFSANTFTGHYISNTRVFKTTVDHNTKVFRVPIRFNTTYTICMENFGDTTFSPAFIKNDNLLKLNNTDFGNNVDISSKYISLRDYTPIKKSANLRFKCPITYRVNNIPETLYRNKSSYSVDGYSAMEIANKDFIVINGKNYKVIPFTSNKINNKYYDVEDTISTYFDRVIISSKDEYLKFIQDGYSIFTQSIISNKVYLKKHTPSNDTSYIGTFLITKVNPSENGWYEYSGSNIVLTTDTSFKGYTNSSGSKCYLEQIECEYNNIVKYDITSDICKIYDSIEKYLYLLIQVPSDYNSNIVVLEGDYTNQSISKYIEEDVYDLNESMMDFLCTSHLSLMNMTSPKAVPFSSRLIEFLLWNAINNLDSINNDMDRLFYLVQGKANKDIGRGIYTNYWTPEFRQSISNYANTYTNGFIFDNLGYVTKDIEKILEKG